LLMPAECCDSYRLALCPVSPIIAISMLSDHHCHHVPASRSVLIDTVHPTPPSTVKSW